MKKKQLSLFPKSVSEDRLLLEANGLSVTVRTKCPVCKSASEILPHRPIHTIEWMRENWTEESDRFFLVVGPCSRECENKIKNTAILSK